MVYIIKTINSIYEIDTKNNKIRKVFGESSTPRQGKFGEWKQYKEIRPTQINVGQPLLVVWDTVVDGKDKILKSTELSNITSKTSTQDLN